jgi:PTH1 family peptidyl-tRNA hydrolase
MDHRHNIGFMVIDELARRWAAPAPREKFGSEIMLVDRSKPPAKPQGIEKILLQKPMEYMNLSGQAVQRVVAFYHIDIKQVIVVHDDIDLPFGRLRVKVGGGHGGHNGLRSISGAIGPAYMRVRCGVGRPLGGKERVVGHVLGPFNKAEQKELPIVIGQAADAVEAVLDHGAAFAMNRFNAGAEPT